MPAGDTYRMRVCKYLPEKLYGFCLGEDGTTEVFFYLGNFQPGADVPVTLCPGCPGPPQCSRTSQAPPPILGEELDVTFAPSLTPGRAPRAVKAVRVSAPELLHGVVESFDPVRRYGFIRGTDKVSYHLHQSEIADGRLPLAGMAATFFAGVREGRPRACHVKVCR